MDAYVLDKTLDMPDGKSLLMESKHFVEIADSNNGSYSSNRITFSLDNIATTASHYFNPTESYITIPLNMAVEFASTANANGFLDDTSIKNNFVASLKNGSYQLIDKINYKLNANELIALDNFENIKINYEILSTWGQDDVQKRGDELMFRKDNTASFEWVANYGSVNNKIGNIDFDNANGFAEPNFGRRERMKLTSGLQSYKNFGSFNTLDNLSDQYLNTVTINGVAAGASKSTTVNYHILMTFRLCDLHPYFKNMPLVKNPQQTLVLHLNTGAVYSYGMSAAGAITAMAGGVSAYVVSNPTNTCPIMISDVGAMGIITGANAPNGAQTVKAQIQVVRATGITNSVAHKESQCKFHACFVKMSNDAEIQLVKSSLRNVVWNECYCQYGGNLSNVVVNGRVSQLISGSYYKLRKLVVVPFRNQASNQGINPIQSVFTTEPATASFATNNSVADFNVRLGINNVYPKNIQYSYETYLHEFQQSNAINGSMVAGTTNGLISLQDWNSAYGYYVVDLSRKIEDNDLRPEQITVQFTNRSNAVMDYVVLVYYEKMLTIDCEKGVIAK